MSCGSHSGVCVDLLPESVEDISPPTEALLDCCSTSSVCDVPTSSVTYEKWMNPLAKIATGMKHVKALRSSSSTWSGSCF